MSEVAKLYGVTVIDRIRSLGLEPDKRLSWPAGIAVRERWELIHGSPPDKALRSKTNGPGTHCFAVYPAWFAAAIDEIVQSLADEVEAEAARQPSLF